MPNSNKTRQFGLCLALLSILSPALAGRSQGLPQPNNLLPPPRAGLLPVHWPDLANLEPEVREQLVAQQNALATTVRNPKITAAALSEAYGMLGENYQAYSIRPAARECYLNAGILAPEDFRWLYLLAVMDQQEDLTDDALRRYWAARKLQPEYVAASVNIGNILLQLNRLQEAKDNFKAALAIDRNCAAALYGLGQVALSQRDYSAAVAHLEAALAIAPGANRIHYPLAMAYRNLGETEKAAAHLAQAGRVGVRASDPLADNLQALITGERVHLMRGKLAIESGRFAEAIVELRQAIAANRDSIPAHINLAAALTQTGDLKGAAEQLAVALRIDPKNKNAHYNPAILLAKENNHAAAIQHLQFILSIDPKDIDARLFLANQLLQSDRKADALAEFSRLAEADPDNEEAALQQVRLLQQQRQFGQAMEILKKAYALYPRKERTALMLAYMLATSPQLDLRDGTRSLQLAQTIYQASNSVEHGVVVAMALAELGRCAEAAEWQRRMIATAEQEHKAEWLAQLNTYLKLYEQGPPCRPPGEI